MFDKLARRDIANDPRWTRYFAPDSFATMLRQNENMPKLEPCLIAGGQYLYDPGDVDRWFAKLDKWIQERPLREATAKSDAERHLLARLAAEQARLKTEFEMLRQGLEATKQRMDDVGRQNAGKSNPVTPWR